MSRFRSAIAPAIATTFVVAALAACGSGSSSSGGQTVEMKLTPAGCDPASVTVPAGSTTFHIVNDGASSISEFEVMQGTKILGEKESLTPGLEGSFTIDLKPGTYTLACPGGTEHATGTLTVTEKGASGSAAAAASSGGAASGACGVASTGQPVDSHLKVELKDYVIAPAASQVSAGTVSFDATNTGTKAHEIVVVKGVAPTTLPTKADGSIDEDALPSGAEVGELEKFVPGNQCSASFALTPGSYTLFCNVVDDAGAHAKLGMVTTLTVG